MENCWVTAPQFPGVKEWGPINERNDFLQRKFLQNLPKELFSGVPDDVVVVDTGNYYPQRDGRLAAIEDGMTEGRWVATQLGRSVVKAFDNMNFRYLLEGGRPKGTPGRIAVPVAGDDQRAKQVVMRLGDELGFDPVDAGGLDDSWRQQPGTPLYDIPSDAAAVRRALREASPERQPEWRATVNSPVNSAGQPDVAG